MACLNNWIKANYNRPKSDAYVPLNEWIKKDIIKSLEPSDYVSYLFHETWECSFQQATLIIQEFLDSKYFLALENMLPVDDSIKYLIKLKDEIELKYKNSVDLYVVTSRQSRIKHLTRLWILKYFVNPKNNKCIFKDIVFGNHFGLQGIKLSKPELCKKIGASILIDDRRNYAQMCAPMLEKVLLFDWKNSYSWSKQIKFNQKKEEMRNDYIGKYYRSIIGAHKLETLPLHPNITKVENWEQAYNEIIQFLNTYY